MLDCMGDYHYYEKTTENDERCFFCDRPIPRGTTATAIAGFGAPFCEKRCAEAQVRDH
mgnify:FL=1